MATTRNGVFIFILCCLQLFYGRTTSTTFLRIKNFGSHAVWPAILSKPGSPQLPKTTSGFSLRPGQSKLVAVPPEWTGIVWGRNLCTYLSYGNFSCITGDCGSSTLECPSGTAAPPTTTAAVFTRNSASMDGEYTYFVSLMRGYNLPMMVVPIGGRAGRYCRASGCNVDLNKGCPKELRVMYGDEGVGCNVVECQAPHEDYCSGITSTYSNFFKRSCPLAHSSAFDKSTTFTCLSVETYDVTFCASSFPIASASPDGYYETEYDAQKSNYYNSKGHKRNKPKLISGVKYLVQSSL